MDIKLEEVLDGIPEGIEALRYAAVGLDIIDPDHDADLYENWDYLTRRIGLYDREKFILVPRVQN